MPGTTTIDSSITFDPYMTTSFDASQLQTYPDFSPVSFFDTEDFATDFTPDSPVSPLSPLSPALSASSFGFPTTDAWTAWDSAELSPEPEKLFECQTFASCSPTNATSSPVINPLDLTLPTFFQSPQVMLATVPSPQQLTADALPTPPTPSAASPTTDTAATKRYPSRGLKRKSASDRSDSEPAPKLATVSPTSPTTTSPSRPSATAGLGPKKTAHNMIEKRYRTNLNDKITQLRDAVPSLRLLAQQRSTTTTTTTAAAAADPPADEDEGEDSGVGLGNGMGGGGGGGGRLNKATILSKATEYIMQLERRNMGLEAENGALRGRMEGLEILLMSRARSGGGGGGGGGVVGERGGLQVVGGWN